MPNRKAKARKQLRRKKNKEIALRKRKMKLAKKELKKS
jgi:hypothetical protein